MKYAYQNKFVRIIAFVVDFLGGLFFIFIRLRRYEINKGSVKKMLVVKLDQLGDCFLSTPIFEYLQEAFPESTVDLVCQENATPIFQGNPFIMSIITFNYPRMARTGKRANLHDYVALIGNLRRRHYDLFIDLRGEPFVTLLGFLTGARYRVGFKKEEVGGFFYTHPLRYNRSEHETRRYEEVLRVLGIENGEWQPKIYISEKERRWFEKVAGKQVTGPFIAVHPGAGLDYKRWPTEKFTTLIGEILLACDIEVILLGSLVERKIGEKIKTKIQNPKVKNLMGEISLRETYMLIARSNLFIGNDSVLAHFAGALNVPTIEIMNSVVDDKRWKAIGGKVIVIKGIDRGHVCSYDKCVYPCMNMETITAADVLLEVKKSCDI